MQLPMGGLHQRPARQNEQERRQKGEPGHQHRRRGTRQKQGIGTEHRFHIAAHKGHKSHHHDQRPRRRFAQRQTIDHLCGRQPAIVRHTTLIHVGQHRVSAAKRQQRRLGEKPAHLCQRVVPAQPAGECRHGHHPQHHTHRHHPRQARPAEARVIGRGGVVVDQGRQRSRAARAMAPAPQAEHAGRPACAQKPHQRRAQNDHGKRQLQGKDRHKSRSGHGPHRAVFQRP